MGSDVPVSRLFDEVARIPILEDIVFAARVISHNSFGGPEAHLERSIAADPSVTLVGELLKNLTSEAQGQPEVDAFAPRRALCGHIVGLVRNGLLNSPCLPKAIKDTIIWY